MAHNVASARCIALVSARVARAHHANLPLSHAITKSAVLSGGHTPTRAPFAPEQIFIRTAGADELKLGARVLARLPFWNLRYARVDLLRDAGGSPCVLELEPPERSLYLGYCPHAPTRLAEAVSAHL